MEAPRVRQVFRSRPEVAVTLLRSRATKVSHVLGLRVRAAYAVQDLTVGRHGERVLVCSSNGLLRWLLDLVPGSLDAALAEGAFRVKIGHLGKLMFCARPDPGPPGWWVLSRNRPPDAPLP